MPPIEPPRRVGVHVTPSCERVVVLSRASVRGNQLAPGDGTVVAIVRDGVPPILLDLGPYAAIPLAASLIKSVEVPE